MNRSILHIMVIYKNHSQSLEFLDQALAQGGSEHVDFLWLDNSNEELLIPQKGSQVRTYLSQENAGYIGVIEPALRHLQIDPRNYKYVIVSNTDLRFRGDRFYEQLMQAHVPGEVGMLGPSLRSERSGQESNPFLEERPPVKKIEFLEAIFAQRIVGSAYQTAALFRDRFRKRFGKVHQSEDLKPKNCYSVHGSFMIFTNAFFYKGLQLKYPVFLYGEEIHFAELCRLKNLKVQFLPFLQMVHQEHGAIGLKNLIMDKNIANFRAQSLRYLKETYFSE